jgi:prolipoprotein diacylglyceryltransferase
MLIINIPQGGLFLGWITMFFFLHRHNMDVWLFLDSIIPPVLLSRAIARPANFIIINYLKYG